MNIGFGRVKAPSDIVFGLVLTAAILIPTILWCQNPCGLSSLPQMDVHQATGTIKFHAPRVHLSFPFGEHVEFGLCEHCSLLLDLRLNMT